MKLGIDPTVINQAGENLFHFHVLGGQVDFYFDRLVQLGLDINKKNKDGWTPLHLAYMHRITDVLIEKFVLNGADLHARTDSAWSGNESNEWGPPSAKNSNAFEVRMKYLNSLEGEYSEGTEIYEILKNKYIDLLMPKE